MSDNRCAKCKFWDAARSKEEYVVTLNDMAPYALAIDLNVGVCRAAMNYFWGKEPNYSKMDALPKMMPRDHAGWSSTLYVRSDHYCGEFVSVVKTKERESA